jgi:hypothetical protein
MVELSAAVIYYSNSKQVFVMRQNSLVVGIPLIQFITIPIKYCLKAHIFISSPIMKMLERHQKDKIKMNILFNFDQGHNVYVTGRAYYFISISTS